MGDYQKWLAQQPQEIRNAFIAMQAAYCEYTQLRPDQVKLVTVPRLFGPGWEFHFAPKVQMLAPASLG